jgi:hypothetical protein
MPTDELIAAPADPGGATYAGFESRRRTTAPVTGDR